MPVRKTHKPTAPKLKRRIGGRPLKEIDERVVRNLASRLCSQREIAAIVGCDEGTLRYRFSAIIAEARNSTLGNLKLKVLSLAMAPIDAKTGKTHVSPAVQLDAAKELMNKESEWKHLLKGVVINNNAGDVNNVVVLDEKKLAQEFNETLALLKQHPERKRLDARPVIEMEE
jgi:hypothetical protein